MENSQKMRDGISLTKIRKNAFNTGKNNLMIFNFFLKNCLPSHFGPLKCGIRPFKDIKIPCFSCEFNHFMESKFPWFMIWLTLFYDSVENGWNVFGWKMLGEIRKGLKVFGWNEKNAAPMKIVLCQLLRKFKMFLNKLFSSLLGVLS